MTTKASKVRHAPAKTFHPQTVDGQEVWVKDGYILVPCPGDAHRNPNIDHCPCCLNHTWGFRAIPNAAPGAPRILAR